MKKILLALTLAGTLLLSGCSPLTGDITDLMKPPKLTADQQKIEQTLNGILGKNAYTLQYPTEGQYRSSIILHNIDGDAEDEALALYRPNSENTGTHVMVLKKYNSQWKKLLEINGDGQKVDQLDFGDFYDTGYDNIAIAWTQLTGTDLGLSIYNGGGKLYSYSGAFNQMRVVNLTNNNFDDMLLLKLDTTAHKTSSCSLISNKEGKLMEIDSTTLDPTVDSFASIHATKIDGQNAVLIDAYKGLHDMVTQLLIWRGNVLVAPLNDNAKRLAPPRDVLVTCGDYDDDGVIEIPSATELPGYADIADYDKKMWLVSWSVYNGGAMQPPKYYTVINNPQGYYFIFPPNWLKKVTIDSSLGDDHWIFKSWDGSKPTVQLFTLAAYTQKEWDQMKEDGGLANTYELRTSNGIVYSAVLNPKASDDPSYPTINDIRNAFKLMQ